MDKLQLIFISITLLCFVLFYLGTSRDKRVLYFFAFWIIGIGILSYTGFFQYTEGLPPRMIWMIIPSLFYIIYFYRKIDISQIKLAFLLSIHILRLPVELVLYQLFLQGKVPIIMTYRGWNLDILVGISAILLLLYLMVAKVRLNPLLFKVWNIIGLVFLSIIVITAILSAPSPFQQFAFEQPNVGILAFPYTLLPAVVVPIVLLSHLLSLASLKKAVVLKSRPSRLQI